MATYECFQECQNALDNLTETCNTAKYKRNVFINVANHFQKVFERITPNYWKADQNELQQLTKTFNKLINKIHELNNAIQNPNPTP